MRHPYLKAAVLAVAVFAGALWLSGLPTTRASYFDRVTSTASVVATDGAGAPQPACAVRISPGRSRACYYSLPCPFPKVARVSDDGDISLDYGEIWRDGFMRSSEVLQIRNVGDCTLKLRCSVSGDIAALFGRLVVSPSNLKPGKTAVLTSELRPDGAPAGEYEGFIRIFDASGELDISLPVRVLVLEESSCDAQGAAPAIEDPAAGSNPSPSPSDQETSSTTPSL